MLDCRLNISSRQAKRTYLQAVPSRRIRHPLHNFQPLLEVRRCVYKLTHAHQVADGFRDYPDRLSMSPSQRGTSTEQIRLVCVVDLSVPSLVCRFARAVSGSGDDSLAHMFFPVLLVGGQSFITTNQNRRHLYACSFLIQSQNIFRPYLSTLFNEADSSTTCREAIQFYATGQTSSL